MGFLKKIGKVLTAVTDFLIAGRKLGLWSKKHKLPKHSNRLDR